MKHRTQFLLIVILFTAFIHNSYAINDSTFVHEVFDRLITVATHSDKIVWPPTIEITDDNVVNAYAFRINLDDSNRIVTGVEVTKKLLSMIVKDDPDALAGIIGHEIAHIILGHLKPSEGKTDFLKLIFSREDELSADKMGLQLVLAAGYSYQKAINALKKFYEMRKDYNSFQSFSKKHPSWKERLEAVDKEQSTLWSAMCAFGNGNTFLLAQQYALAERCFKKVTEEFPSSYEAWTNLGYALLMQYCDALSTDDLKLLNIGHLMTGGFYRRAESLESKIRGGDEEQWWNAVAALQEAIKLKPDLALAKANLGIAFLVHPNGRDAKQAAKYFSDAIELNKDDFTMKPSVKASIYMNAGVAAMANGQTDLANDEFTLAEMLIKLNDRIYADDTRQEFVEEIIYNKAELLSRSDERSDRDKALQLFEDYLQNASENSLWYEISYERYFRLCKMQSITPKRLDEFHSIATNSYKPIYSIDFEKNKFVTLLEQTEDVHCCPK